MVDIIIDSAKKTEKKLFCDYCGRRLEDSDEIKGKCVVCRKKLCERCIRETKGRLFCPSHVPKPPPPPETHWWDSLDCFIATAAYGTPIANEIDLLRNWRDKTLMEKPMGRILVSSYYKISPPVAYTISKSETLKSFTRLSLSPIIKHFKKNQNNN